jgi:hypothetical protein
MDPDTFTLTVSLGDPAMRRALAAAAQAFDRRPTARGVFLRDGVHSAMGAWAPAVITQGTSDALGDKGGDRWYLLALLRSI